MTIVRASDASPAPVPIPASEVLSWAADQGGVVAVSGCAGSGRSWVLDRLGDRGISVDDLGGLDVHQRLVTVLLMRQRPDVNVSDLARLGLADPDGLRTTLLDLDTGAGIAISFRA